MALLSLSSLAAFFESAVRMPMIHIVSPNFFDKEPGHVFALVHASMGDKTYPVQLSFSDSLRARIRCSRTNVGPKIQDPEENESANSKTNLFYFIDCVRPRKLYNMYCRFTTPLSGPGHWCSNFVRASV